MSVAIAGPVPATFEFKSANLPLLALLLKSTDLSTIARELSERFGALPEFFDHDPLVIDLAPLGDAEVDFKALVKLLKPYRVLPVAVRGGSARQRDAAWRAGLAVADDASAPSPALPQKGREQAPEAPPPPASALVIDRPLRSGQQVYARGRDLVVLSMVNPGAEVIADGHIHVYAPLRGKAIAGARGNTEARIFTTCLEAQLVAIAGIYRTSEVALPDEVAGKAAQISLQDGKKIVMQAIE